MQKITLSIFCLWLTLVGMGQKNQLDDFYGPMFFDTYHQIWSQSNQWSIYNVHDPSVLKSGDEFVMYSTDVAMGGSNILGLHRRRSFDLVNWQFDGTAFDGAPASALNWMLQQSPGYQAESLWAPYILKVADEYRLYYSISVFGTTTSFMGMAISESAFGPWVDMGKVLTTVGSDNKNAIDPSIVTDQETGQQWMAYGSYWTGIYIVELDPETGFVKNADDYGINVARRGANSLEAAELLFHEGWYYLFVSYGWLEDSYNVRVGRSEHPQGPYFDYSGVNMVQSTDNFPQILRPYRFNHHVGWQGTGHCSVFSDGDKVFMANQGRPTTSIFNMVLHLREIFWIDGWPVVSPQRFANVPQWDIHPDSIVGKWENIRLQPAGSLALPWTLTFNEDGTINNSAHDTWWLNGDTLHISQNNGQKRSKLIVHWGWDWENRHTTLLFTGLESDGINSWGKKINQEAIDAYTVLEHGSSYNIRSHYSNKLIEAQSNEENSNVRIRADMDTDVQEWVVVNADNGYFQLTPVNSVGMVLEVANANSNNGGNIQIGLNVNGDHQKWKLNYLNNGYFSMLSKISNDTRGLDVANFAVHDGANIIQWEFLNGNNQIWRFEKLKSGLNPDLNTSVVWLENSVNEIKVYPNPVSGSELFVQFGDRSGNLHVKIFDMKGTLVYSAQANGSTTHVVENRLNPGVYIITVEEDGRPLGKGKRIVML